MVSSSHSLKTMPNIARDGDDDPEKPSNWSALSKFMLSGNVMLLTVMTYLGSSIYTLGISGPNGVMDDFGVSMTTGM